MGRTSSTKRYSAALRSLDLFSPEERRAVATEYLKHQTGIKGLRRYPTLSEQLPPVFVATVILDKTVEYGSPDGRSNCLTGEANEAFQRAYQKADPRMGKLWTRVCDEQPHIVAAMDIVDRACLHIIHKIPEEKLGLYRKSA